MIFNLGDLEFISVEDENNTQGSKVADTNLVTSIAKLLEINLNDFILSLTTSAVCLQGEIVNKSKTVEESIAMKNSLANELYSRLFDYIVLSINQLLSYSLQVHPRLDLVNVIVRTFLFTKLSLFTKSSPYIQ